MKSPDRPRYSLGEEIASSAIHGLGAIFGVVALAVLAAYSSLYGEVWHVVGCSIFAATLILLYTASTLYHGIPHRRAKGILRAIDHSAIYLLIAGTYTPFTLVNLRGPWGWSLFGIVWGTAAVGIAVRWSRPRSHSVVTVLAYVCLGWLAVVAIVPMLESVAPGGLLLLLLGGLFYTSGVPFYLAERLPYNHAIWHVFVLFGSVLHFFAVLFYVIPLAE